MVISEIRLFELLKAKIGEKEAEAFVEILERKVDQKFTEAKTELATKADLAEIKAELLKWMFIFWVGQVGVLVALLALFVHHS